jgi:hypothetical protein
MNGALAAREEPAPQVTELEGGDDRIWFSEHPDRIFRARPASGGIWLIRRRRQGADPDVLLRTFVAFPVAPHDDDLEIGVEWYCHTFGLERWAAAKLTRRLLRKGRRGRK